MCRLLFLLPGLAAALAFVGCGETTVTEKQVLDDLCARRNVDCNDPTGAITCDPSDGVCKCGGELGNGVFCEDGQGCVIDPPASPSCVSELCTESVCGRYETCDPRDGLCKCGGVQCAFGSICVDGACEEADPCEGVTCPDGEVCDPADQICKCGKNVCSAGETCRAGRDGARYCLGRNCIGMNCLGGTECSPLDGLCHCGNADGPVCPHGQACLVDEETGNGSCSGDDLCEGKVCPGGTACSPLDGLCRCGGFDNAAPICGPNQTCDQAGRSCLGGDMCKHVECTPGSNFSCDEEEGICKCGGTGGLLCEPEAGCVKGKDTPYPLCVKRCSPLRGNLASECGADPIGCYFAPESEMAFCATPGEGSEGQKCDWITDCASGFHCVRSATGGECRRYCDINANDDSPHACFYTAHRCIPLAGVETVAPYLGVCMAMGT